MDLLEERLPEMVCLEEMAELQDGRLIWHRLPAQIDADEGAHRLGIVQCLFRPRIGEVDPLLEEKMRSMRSKPTGGLPVSPLG